LLKKRFEAAGLTIDENRALEVDGYTFEVDGFDAERRVGYEYVTAESGDGWDVDDNVIAALDAHRKRGDLFVLIVDEAEARDAAALGKIADAFLAGLPKAKPAAKKADPKADKPAARKADKPAAKKPAATKPEKKPARKR